MQVMLGDLILRTTEKPDFVQHGGGQMLAVNTFPGGNVSIQNFGSTYREISKEIRLFFALKCTFSLS